MGTKRGYLTGYAVVRVDDGSSDDPSSVRQWTIQGAPFLTAGPSNVIVKEVVMTVEEAQREVMRLNALNDGKGCRYYWQSTHIFLDGGSHGSAGPTAPEFRDWLQEEMRSGRMTLQQRDDLLEQKRIFDSNRTEIEQQFQHQVVGFVGGMRKVSATVQELLAEAQRSYPSRMVYFEPIGVDGQQLWS